MRVRRSDNLASMMRESDVTVSRDSAVHCRGIHFSAHQGRSSTRADGWIHIQIRMRQVRSGSSGNKSVSNAIGRNSISDLYKMLDGAFDAIQTRQPG